MPSFSLRPRLVEVRAPPAFPGYDGLRLTAKQQSTGGETIGGWAASRAYDIGEAEPHTLRRATEVARLVVFATAGPISVACPLTVARKCRLPDQAFDLDRPSDRISEDSMNRSAPHDQRTSHSAPRRTRPSEIDFVRRQISIACAPSLSTPTCACHGSPPPERPLRRAASGDHRRAARTGTTVVGSPRQEARTSAAALTRRKRRIRAYGIFLRCPQERKAHDQQDQE